MQLNCVESAAAPAAVRRALASDLSAGRSPDGAAVRTLPTGREGAARCARGGRDPRFQLHRSGLDVYEPTSQPGFVFRRGQCCFHCHRFGFVYQSGPLGARLRRLKAHLHRQYILFCFSGSVEQLPVFFNAARLNNAR